MSFFKVLWKIIKYAALGLITLIWLGLVLRIEVPEGEKYFEVQKVDTETGTLKSVQVGSRAKEVFSLQKSYEVWTGTGNFNVSMKNTGTWMWIAAWPFIALAILCSILFKQLRNLRLMRKAMKEVQEDIKIKVQ